MSGSQAPDLTGMVFGEWTVVERAPQRGAHKDRWLCRCSCGTERDLGGTELRKGKSKSCGCKRGHPTDIAGQVFRNWTVLRVSERRQGASLMWLCRCVCGMVREVSGTALRFGASNGCGCIRGGKAMHGHARHGGMESGTYRSWRAMVRRCTEPTNKDYPRWGGNGIKVCDRWLEFPAFLADMGERPKGCTIDRYPNQNGDYEPGNCRWATPKEQGRNRYNNVIVEWNNQSHCIAEWAELKGLPAYLVWRRLKQYGWSAERALTTPATKRGGQ